MSVRLYRKVLSIALSYTPRSMAGKAMVPFMAPELGSTIVIFGVLADIVYDKFSDGEKATQQTRPSSSGYAIE